MAARSDPHRTTVTSLLEKLRAGDRDAYDELLPLVYSELRQAAARQRRRWQGDETLDTTALVHETYLRLVDQSAPNWRCRAHFLAVASTAMRQILVNYAKRKHSATRGGRHDHVPFHEIEATLGVPEDVGEAGVEALIALDDALHRLMALDERQGRIVECRFFGRMTIRATAEALGVSPATVKRGWVAARVWLYRDLKESLEGSG